jgi:hypothetical protein
MCPRSDSQLTYMTLIAFTAEFTLFSDGARWRAQAIGIESLTPELMAVTGEGIRLSGQRIP